MEKEKNEIEDIFNKYSEKLISSKSKEKTLSDKKETEKEQMKSAILREGFESINHVKNNILRKEELLELKEEVEVYKENISNIQGAIINLTNKIGGKSITKNQYEEHKILKASKNNELITLNEFLIKLKDEIDRINEKLKEQKKSFGRKKEYWNIG